MEELFECDCCGHQTENISDLYWTNGDGYFNEQHLQYDSLCEECYEKLKIKQDEKQTDLS